MGCRSGLTRSELLIIVAIILAILAICIPAFLSSERASNERLASTSLKTITSAEADFRANDRDGNKVNDFWTADVKGLYTMTSAEILGATFDPKDPALRLIDLDLAKADADGTPVAAGGENLPLRAFGAPADRKGYWYVALLSDRTDKSIYRQDTGGKPPMGKVHHESKFGFAAFPDSRSKGHYYFQVNENNTIFRKPVEKSVRLGEAVPPGLNGVAPDCLHWPDDNTFRSFGLKGGD